MPQVEYENQVFGNYKKIAEYIRQKYPDDSINRIVKLVDDRYGTRKAMYNETLQRLLSPEDFEKYKKTPFSRLKYYAGKSLRLNELIDELVNNTKLDNYSNLNQEINNLFQNDTTSQFKNDFTRIRYLKEIIASIKHHEEIPMDIRMAIKLNEKDIRIYAEYQNLKQKEYRNHQRPESH